MKQCKCVAVFDSGIGGLTLLAECMRLLPDCRFIYLGDNGRAPYGNLPSETIGRYAAESMAALAKNDIAAAVIACNTVTADAADAIRKKYDFPIVGVEPAVLPAARRGGKVLVLATRATLASSRYASLCARAESMAEIISFAPERLAGEIEKKMQTGEKIDLSDHLPEMRCDSVVLGCTHYIFLKEQIKAFYGAPVFDGNMGAAQRLKFLLGQGGYNIGQQKLGTENHLNEYTNKCLKNCVKMAKKRVVFMGNAKKINKMVFLSLF